MTNYENNNNNNNVYLLLNYAFVSIAVPQYNNYYVFFKYIPIYYASGVAR